MYGIAHCRSHGDGSSLRKARKTCKRCAWDGYRYTGDVRKTRGYNGRSHNARLRDVKPNGGGGIIGTSAGDYTRRISRDHAEYAARRVDDGRLSVVELAATRGWN